MRGKWKESSSVQTLAAPSINRDLCGSELPICHNADVGPQRACMNSLLLHGDLLLGPALVSADGSFFSSCAEEEGFLPASLLELSSVCCCSLSWSCDPVGVVAPGATNGLLSQYCFSRLPRLLLLGDMSVLGTHGLEFASFCWESVSGIAWLLKRSEACGSVVGSSVNPMLEAATRFPVMPFSAVAKLIGGVASRPFKGSKKPSEPSANE